MMDVTNFGHKERGFKAGQFTVQTPLAQLNLPGVFPFCAHSRRLQGARLSTGGSQHSPTNTAQNMMLDLD
jgi:hypothetical protein